MESCGQRSWSLGDECGPPAPAEASNLPLYVGTSGWAYAIWKPDFYSKEVASKNFLKYYATQLTAVEVNYTFRRSLSEKAATGWMADVGPNFRFALKANQYITHIRRLQNVEEAMQRFLPTLQPLAAQLGPGAFPDAADCQSRCRRVARFPCVAAEKFQGGIRIPPRIVVQRRRSIRALAGYATATSVHRRAETEKLNTPEVRTANYIYFRFRQPSYSPEDLKKLIERVWRCVADGLETYAFFKHEEDPRSPHNAVEGVAVRAAGTERDVERSPASD